MTLVAILFFAAAVLVPDVTLAQVALTGTVRVATREGAPQPPVVVYAQPVDRPAPTSPGKFTLSQQQKAFVPAVLGVPVGSTVEFPNKDPIFHNVFSLSSPAPFDLGLYRSGASKSRTFKQAAAYRVFCNIHPQMAALVVVTPTPYVTVTGREGSFTLDVPAGRYRVTATTGRTEPVTSELQVDRAATTMPTIEIDERAIVDLPHKNKFGREYPKEAYK